MEDKARNQEEAMHWFMHHSDGALTCIGQDGQEQDCWTYRDAFYFFEEHGQDENRIIKETE